MAVFPVYVIISSPNLNFPGASAVASVNPAVDPTFRTSESAGRKEIEVSSAIAAVVAALIVIVVPLTFVTVVPAVTPATSTMSPTEIFVLASTTIVVAPAATGPSLRT